MPPIVSVLLASVTTWLRSRLSMQMELIALRHQVAVYKQRISRPKLRPKTSIAGTGKFEGQGQADIAQPHDADRRGTLCNFAS